MPWQGYNLSHFYKSANGNETTVAGYTSPGLRVAKRINSKWEPFFGIQYFKSTDKVSGIIELNYEIISSQNEFEGFNVTIGRRYYLINKNKWDLYASAAIMDRFLRYSTFYYYKNEQSIDFQNYNHLDIGLETGIGASFKMTPHWSLRAEVLITPIEYQKNILRDPNGIKGLSHSGQD